MVEARETAARGAIVDGMMRRQECAILGREMASQEAAAFTLDAQVAELREEVRHWREEAERKRRVAEEAKAAMAAAAQTELQRQLAVLSQQLLY